MAELIEMPFGLWTRVGPIKHLLDGAQIPHAKGQLLGEDMPDNTAMSCAKMAEPIDLPFGLWTRIGRRKHKFNCIRRWCQCAVMGGHVIGGHIGATWQIVVVVVIICDSLLYDCRCSMTQSQETCLVSRHFLLVSCPLVL